MQDGNIHCHINNVSKKADRLRDRSAIAAASYNAGVEIFSDKEQRHIAVRDKDGVIFTGIVAPSGSPDWVQNRATLWNTVEAEAKRADARLAKKIEVAFTRDIPPHLRVELLREFAASFVAMGCVVDMAIHADDADHNPHAHLLLTTRLLENGVFASKLTNIDQKKFINDTRARWASLTNKYLEKAGSPVRVDHRSYKARGIGLEPTRHRGPQHHQEPSYARASAHERRASHAISRSSEEPTMKRPTAIESRDYPHLTTREEWPPAREPAQDMTSQQRDEHQRYWQDKDNEQVDRLAMDLDIEHDPQFPEPQQDKYAAAVQRAQDERSASSVHRQEFSGAEHYREGQQIEREVRAKRDAYQQDLYRRAMELKRTDRENDLLRMAKQGSHEMKQYVRDVIVGERMQRVQENDNARRRAELEKAMSLAERQQLAALIDHERDYPQEGPNRELLPAHEVERAKDEMVRDMEQDYWQKLTNELEVEPEIERERDR